MLKLNKNSSRQVAGTLAALFAFAGLAGTAAADAVPPTTTYPAQMCQSNSSSLQSNLHQVFNNSSTGAITAQCPIPDQWSGRIGAAEVRVVDRHPTANITCTIYVLRNDVPHGNGWWQTRSSTGSANVSQALVFPAIGTKGQKSHYFNMQCSVPARSSGIASALKSYWVFEN